MGESVAGSVALKMVPSSGAFDPDDHREFVRRARHLHDRVKALEAEAFELVQFAESGGVSPKSPAAQAALRKAERDGVAGVVIRPVPGGHVVAEVEGFDHPVLLGGSAILPALLEALCEPGDGEGPLVDYKSPAQLIEAIERISTKTIDEHALRQHIGTLRGRFAQAGMSRRFVPNKHSVGYRLVLRRDGRIKVLVPRRRGR